MRSKSVPVNLLIRKIHTALGEEGEEGSPEGVEKVEGEEDGGSMTPTTSSPLPPEEDGMSPPPGDLASPTSPRSGNEDSTQIRESNSRCDSRESMDSPESQRLPPTENERLLAERAFLQGVPLGAALSPVGVALPPNLPAASLLPPQSAAMAAYISAAAAAAVQSQRLMMTSPSSYSRIAPVSPLITSTSPPGLMHPPSEYSPHGETVLDYSRRSKDEDSDSDAVNLSKSGTPPPEGALDLSVSSSRKRPSEDTTLIETPHRKQRTEYKPEFKHALPHWPPGLGASHLPYFAAAVAAAGLSPKNNPADFWNGKIKPPVPPTQNDATKALEKMSELSKLGGEDLFRTMATAVPSNSSSNRHSAWQSHWLNKGADQAKDVLKCVWCKQSFPSLAALTTHMKEAKHCGVNVPVPHMQSNSLPPQPQMTSPSHSNSSNSSNSHKPQNDLNMLIKETMPLPRKLVRGQDVWLGKGAEQTRQILKCMWCGQSFRSLAEMTTHMQQTQHYTNIISQEQIISWKSSDDKDGRGGGNSGSGGGSGNSGAPPGATSSHVSAVLTCKVCDQAFTSLKDLSNHMVKNSHYKEHIMRSITECGGRRRQTREKRKKSLPVRKLLELERAQHDIKNGDSGALLEKIREQSSAGRITCEKCGHKIETSMFVDHIRQCVGGMTTNQRNFLKSALMSNNILPPESPNRDKIKTPSDKSPSPSSQRSPSVSDLSTKEPSESTNNGSSPSVLNAIEKLIEKSFDSRSRQNANFPGHPPAQPPLGSSILKRLGIDESVDYTKPLVDSQTMNLLRSYQHQQGHHYNRRERSGSESSSISERGSSRVDSLTPERKISESQGIPLMPTPRSTPDIKREKSPFDRPTDVEASIEKVTIKKEIKDYEEIGRENRTPENLKVKKEVVDENDDDEKQSFHSNGDIKQEEEKRRSYTASPQNPPDRVTPNSPDRTSLGSPVGSDRSGTPRSTTSDRKSAGGSLGALSSMFDNLSGANALEGVSSGSGNRKSSSHPLAALQKLCDKTETHTNNRSHPATVTSASTPVPCSTPNSTGTTPGAILAFSWACNDAVMTPDSIMKCAFCDTPFISKGAYRHHLSKMHFVKDGVIPDPIALKSTPTTGSSSVGIPLKGTTSLPSSSVGGGPSSGEKSPPNPGGFEESPHSKFLKYTELAKQLSSKYV